MRTSLPKNQETGPSAGQKRQYPVRKPRLRPIRAITSPYRRTEVVDQTFLSFSYRKSLVASEQCSIRIRLARRDWQERRMPAIRRKPERLVFSYETIVKTNLTRLQGLALRGRQLRMGAPFGRWGTQTFIAGLTSQGLIAPWVIRGAMDEDAFPAYIRNVLVPEPKPGTVVLLDNLATHRNVEAAKTI